MMTEKCAMKPITSFFNSPPPKKVKDEPSGCAQLKGFLKKNTDENCNGQAAVVNGKDAEGAAKVNGIHHNGVKDKNRLSRKKSLVKDKPKVETSVVVIDIADEKESKSDFNLSCSKSANVTQDMSSVEMSYEDFLTSQDPADAEDISVIQDSPEQSLHGVVTVTNEGDAPPMGSEDSQGSQDIFSEDVVAGCPLLKKGAPLDADVSVSGNAVKDSADTSEKLKEKRNSKLSRKSKKETEVVCNEKELAESSEKTAKKTAKKSKSSGGKQMTLFGKVIDNVPKLETDAETQQEDDQDQESLPVDAAPKSKSIMNFFSKADKKCQKKSTSEKVTCQVEIHEVKKSGKQVGCSPSVTPDNKQKTSPRRSNVAVEHIDMSITELGFQIIAVPEKKKRSRRQVIVQSNDTTTCSEAVSSIEDQNNVCKATNAQSSKIAQSTSSENKGEIVADSKPDPVDDDDLVIVGATEDNDKNLRKAQLANQMAYLDTVQVSVSKKATQATLNFSGKGCVIQKAVVEKKEAKEVEVDTSEDSDLEVVVTEIEKQKTGKKTGKKAARERQSIGNNITPPNSTRCSRRCSIQSPLKTPSKRLYAARILPPRRNSLPGLRMKFTSIRSASSADKFDNSTLEEIAKITAKMSKAQQILDKAKKASHLRAKAKPWRNSTANKAVLRTQKKAIEEELISPTLRRSSRQSSVVARTAISECLSPAEFMSPKGNKKIKVTDTSKTPSKTPKSRKTNQEKDYSGKTPRRTPKKKVKMAPIFKAKGKKQEDSEEDEVLVTKVQIDPEVLRVRREFLLSGVPSVLKKQSEASCAVTLDDYPPLPEISHVQQCPSNDDPLWTSFNLKDTSVPCLKPAMPCFELNCPPPEKLTKGVLTESAQDIKQDVKLYGVEEKAFEEETLKYLLAEVSSRNPSFPVRRVYKQLVKKYEQTKGTWVEPSNPSDKDETKDRKNSKKRKLLLLETEEPPRRSKRRCYSDVTLKSDDDCCIVQEDAKPENLDKSRELLWTDKYSPSSVTEVLTNSMNSKRLKGWLEEWRQRTDLEMKKIKKQLMKEAKKDSKIKEEIQKSLGDTWWTDDESDFEIDTEDDSDYEGDDICDGLCNTMVLTGPHGVGKTAMVYAVAQELGYKIFEVNASSKRAGKQMLAELQEATQSHQVAQHNMDKLFTTFKMIQSERRKSSEVAKPDKKLNPIFANFFKNTTKSAVQPNQKGKESKSLKKTPKKTPEKPGKAGKKGGTPGKGNAELARTSPKKGLNLNSTSLILFEEVDVIFEEDKGFWTAIETFMNTTKRPIILTASDPKVAAAVNPRHEVIKIKRSPMVNIASYLQLVCLAEKLRADHSDVIRLVRNCRGDLRQAILTLQYWILSGAGSTKLVKSIMYDPVFFNKKQDSVNSQPLTPLLMKQNVGALDSGKESEEEFEITSFTKKRRKKLRPVIDSGDESSNASPVKPSKFTSSQTTSSDSAAEESQDGFTNVTGVTQKELTVAPVIAPSIHGLMWHSSCGPPVQGISSDGDLMQLLQDPSTSYQAWKLVSWYLSSKFNLIYANLMQLLDLPKVQLVPPRLPVIVKDEIDVKKRRRIKMNSDIFDCEDSDAEQEKPDNAEIEVDEMAEGAKQDESREKIAEKEGKPYVATPEDAVAASGVKILSELYDNLSFSDAYFSSCESIQEGPCGHNQPFDWSSGQLCAGLTGGHPLEIDQDIDSLVCDFHAGLHLYNIRKTNQRLSHLKHKTNTLEPSCSKRADKLLCLPVPSDSLNSADLQLSSECAMHLRVRTCRKQALEYVSSCLPLSIQCNHRAVTCDVMPYMRNICQSEQLRQASNTKRRFTHYLDSVSSGVTRKQNVLDVLCTSFI